MSKIAKAETGSKPIDDRQRDRDALFHAKACLGASIAALNSKPMKYTKYDLMRAGRTRNIVQPSSELKPVA